jgi:serine phosphatase RsbU (regulator of sigma subunit)
MNEKNALFGLEGLEETISNMPNDLSAREMVQRLFDEAERFAGRAKQHDDMTAVAVNVL